MVDYRGLNAQTQHDSYTLPLIEDMLQKQHRRRIFTVIDLNMAIIRCLSPRIAVPAQP